MKTRFYIFLSLIFLLVISFAGKEAHVTTANHTGNKTVIVSQPGGSHFTSSIYDPSKYPNADRYRVRTKANVDSWEISLTATEWNYTAPAFFLCNEQRYYDHDNNIASAYLLITALRGPPAITTFPSLV